MNDRSSDRQTDNATPFPSEDAPQPARQPETGDTTRHTLNRLDSIEHQQSMMLDALRAAGRVPGIADVTLSGATYTVTEEATINNLNTWAKQVDAILRAAGLAL